MDKKGSGWFKKIIKEKDDQLHELNLIKERLSAVLDAVAGIHWWKDINGVYRDCNQTMADSLGLKSKEEIIGKTDYELPWASEADILVHNDKAVMETGRTQRGKEEPVTTNDGKLHTFMVAKAPLYDNSGKIIGTVGNSIDITELKEAQQALEDAKSREFQYFKALSSIGGMMAHELRTPLTTIELSAQNLKKYLPSLLEAYRLQRESGNIKKIHDFQLNYLDDLANDVERAARYASNTIRTILSGFHYSSSEVSPIESVELNEVIQQAIDAYPFTKQERNSVSFSPEKNNCIILASPSIVIHVIHNLLKNALYAIKKTNQGHINILVDAANSQTVDLIFKDTAEGMTPETKERIFEPFYTTKDTETSVGLGLYFCKMALEKMNSSIECDTELGRHTTFTIHLRKS